MKRKAISLFEADLRKIDDCILMLRRLGHGEAASHYEQMLNSDPAVREPRTRVESLKSLITLHQILEHLSTMAGEFERLSGLESILARKEKRSATVN